MALASLPPGRVCLRLCLSLGSELAQHCIWRLVWGCAGRMMAQQLRMLIALAKALSLVSCAYLWFIIACNFSSRGCDALLVSEGSCTYMVHANSHRYMYVHSLKCLGGGVWRDGSAGKREHLLCQCEDLSSNLRHSWTRASRSCVCL